MLKDSFQSCQNYIGINSFWTEFYWKTDYLHQEILYFTTFKKFEILLQLQQRKNPVEIYEISCYYYNIRRYIGQTKRFIRTRFKQHMANCKNVRIEKKKLFINIYIKDLIAHTFLILNACYISSTVARQLGANTFKKFTQPVALHPHLINYFRDWPGYVNRKKL